jgi:ribonuclease Y
MILASFVDWLLIGAGLAVVGFGYGVHVLVSYVLTRLARRKADSFLQEKRSAAQAQVAQSRRKSLEEAEELRQGAMVEMDEDRETLLEFERRLRERSRDLRSKDELLKDRRAELDALRREVRSKGADVKALRRRIGRVRSEGRRILLGIVENTEEGVKQEYLDGVDVEVMRETSRYYERQIQILEEEAESLARIVVDRVVQRMQMSHIRDERPAGVELAEARILEQRGMTPGSPLFVAFQEASGVEVVIDSEAGTVGFNTMDGVRREVARRSMNRILGLTGGDGDEAGNRGNRESAGRRRGRGRGGNGRSGDQRSESWTPESVKKLIERTDKEIRRVLNRKGRKAAQVLKLPGNNKLFEYLGRLNYRTSYGQNILKHSQEVGFLGAMLGAEAGLDLKLAKRCSFLHDIGKCIDYEMEGGHPEIGARLASECGETEIVVNAVEAHHDDVPRKSLYPLVVQAADAISGARPGARRRTAEKYLLRMGQIEDIANSQPGVESAYVIQAGREVRVILEAEKTDDQDASRVANTVARELENEMHFPGKIKVTVIREKKVSAVAK